MNNRLKEHRIKQGMTQEELAKKANVSRYLISKIESGEDVNTTKNTMVSISEALHTSVSTIFLF